MINLLITYWRQLFAYLSPSLAADNTGQLGENQALLFLQQQGLTLVKRNYACKLGEIDLIMLDQQQWVFVEVRVRNNEDYGGALESITLKKRKKIIRCAAYFLQRQAQQRTCRFDVVAINQQSKQFSWIQQAFDEDG